MRQVRFDGLSLGSWGFAVLKILFPGFGRPAHSLRKDAPPDLIPKVNLTMELMIDPGWKTLDELTFPNGQVTVHQQLTPDQIHLAMQGKGKVNAFRRIELYHEQYNAQRRVSVYVPHTRHWPASLLSMVDVETIMRMRQVFADAFDTVPELKPMIARCTSPDDFRRLLKQCLRHAKNSPHITLKV